MVMGEGNSGLKTAIAVAPVADWSLYDSIYTERYMVTPQDNPVGYNVSSVLNRLGNFNDLTNYMLVHGIDHHLTLCLAPFIAVSVYDERCIAIVTHNRYW
jgi:hypothetical protein